MTPKNPYAPPSEHTGAARPRRRFSTDDVLRSRRTRIPTVFGYMNLAVGLLTLISAVIMIVTDKAGAVPEAAGQLSTLGGAVGALALLLVVSGYALLKRLRWAAGMAKLWFVLTVLTLGLACGLGLARGKPMLFAGAFAVGTYAVIYGLVMMLIVNKRHVRAALWR